MASDRGDDDKGGPCSTPAFACAATCRALCRFLGLSTTASVEQCFAALCADWPARRAQPLVLTQQEQESLLQRVDPGLSARFDQQFEAQLAPAPPV